MIKIVRSLKFGLNDLKYFVGARHLKYYFLALKIGLLNYCFDSCSLLYRLPWTEFTAKVSVALIKGHINSTSYLHPSSLIESKPVLIKIFSKATYPIPALKGAKTAYSHTRTMAVFTAFNRLFP
jgi:hypothetical protein